MKIDGGRKLWFGPINPTKYHLFCVLTVSGTNYWGWETNQSQCQRIVWRSKAVGSQWFCLFSWIWVTEMERDKMNERQREAHLGIWAEGVSTKWLSPVYVTPSHETQPSKLKPQCLWCADLTHTHRNKTTKETQDETHAQWRTECRPPGTQMPLYPQIFDKTQIFHSTDAEDGYLLYRFQQFTVGKM